MADIYAMILHKINAPVNSVTYSALTDWGISEGIPADWHNPLATTENCCGGVSMNSDGVKKYPSDSNGAEATAITLLFPAYDAVVHALQAGTSMFDIWKAINQSPWCKGCQKGKYPVVLYDHLGVTIPPPGGGGGHGGGGHGPRSGKHWSALIDQWSGVQHTINNWSPGEYQHLVDQGRRVRKLARE